MDNILQQTFLIGLFAASLRLMTPVLFAALGEIISERAGILNIGVEGQMLMGALAGFLGAYFSGSLLVGVLIAALVGALFSIIVGILCIRLRADQMVVGITVNLLAFGLSSFVFRAVFRGVGQPPSIAPLPKLDLPFLKDIPFLGPILFQQNAFFYAAILLAFAVWVFLYKTGAGLKTRAVGEYPLAAEVAGISVIRTRFLCLLAGGAMAGIGGSAITVGELHLFMENVTAGRGFIALAIVIFGKWDPFKVMLGAFIFGWADAFQLRLQGIGLDIPYQFLLMVPYVLTIFVLIGVVGNTRPPASLGKPYFKEEK